MPINCSDTEYVAHVRESDKIVQSLWNHLKETSQLAGQFADKIGLKEHGELLGILHDLGKATETFNNYIKSGTGMLDPDADEYVDAKSMKGRIDHSSAGAQYLRHLLENGKPENQFIAQILPLVIMSHHSGLVDCITPDGSDNFSRKTSKEDERTRCNEAVENSEKIILADLHRLVNQTDITKRFNAFLMGLREASDTADTINFKMGLVIRYLFSCLIDADRLNTADFEFPENKNIRNHSTYENWEALVEKLETHLSTFKRSNEIDSLRSEISEHCLSFSQKEKGLYQLTVPTGGGKTLSSLRFALHHAEKHRMDRVLYLVPFTSIIDQNAHTARCIFEERLPDGTYTNRIVLEHHSNLTPDEENTRQKLLSENWDAPIIFTTMVQFLETLFGYGTRNARRMHQLANSILIFDEIQTLPVNCVHMFNVAVRFLVRSCGATVVLCTATQPLLDKVEPLSRALKIENEQKIIPDEALYFKAFKRVQIIDDSRFPEGWSEEEVTELALKEARLIGSVLVVVNVKKSASRLYQELSGHEELDVYHLSTSMCPSHRMNILAQIRDKLDHFAEGMCVKPIVCVSTQLIEAGVDIDFGSVIRYSAGMDSILQAAGRCNRHGLREGLGRVHVINPSDENLEKLRDIQIGKDKSIRVLGEYAQNMDIYEDGLTDLKIIEQYYRYYFYDRKDEMDYKITSKSSVGRNDNLFSLLSSNGLSRDAYKRMHSKQNPPLPVCQSFMSAAKEFKVIGAYTIGVIVPYEEGDEIIKRLCSSISIHEQYKLIKQAQRYSVNLFAYQFDKLKNDRIIHETQLGSGVFYLSETYYSKEFGFNQEQIDEMKVLMG